VTAALAPGAGRVLSTLAMPNRLRGLLAGACALLLFTGGACQRPTDSAPGAPPDAPPAATEPATEVDPVAEGAEAGHDELLVDVPDPTAADPAGPDAPEGAVDYPPAAMGDRIEIEPDEPEAGQVIRIRAGPLTFRNGCEGIERSTVEGPDAEGRILVGWKARPVPPDAFCTMALHTQWIDVTLEDLPAGAYTVVVPGVGEKALEVLSAEE
jgi:hypothetical protein